MKCKNLHKKLIFFLEGDLSPKMMEEVQNHLDECSSCAAFAKELKQTLGIIETEKELEVNPYFYTRLKARLENQNEQSPAFGRGCPETPARRRIGRYPRNRRRDHSRRRWREIARDGCGACLYTQGFRTQYDHEGYRAPRRSEVSFSFYLFSDETSKVRKRHWQTISPR